MEKLCHEISVKRIISALFLLFALYWFACMNRYNVLYYQEQTQLFLFDKFYFQTYWTQAGGLLFYLGSFFTQFSYYPVLGACIYGGSVWLTAVLYDRIRKYYRLNSGFLFSFFPAACMVFANADLNFKLSYTLNLLLVLGLFRIYLSLPRRYRFSGAALMIFLVYLSAGGNVFLFLLLILGDLFVRQKEEGITDKAEKALAWTALSLAIPWCAWKFWYVVPLKEAFLEASPWNLFYPNYFYMAAWLAFPILLLVCPAFKKPGQAGKPAGIVSKLIPAVLTAGLLAGGVLWSYNKQANLTVQMSYLLEKEEWEKATELSSQTLPSELTAYFNNIALYKTGQLSERMFHYNQIGASGLMLGKKNGYFNRYAMGILFYHLGITAEAKHCAFEALVGNSIFKEPGAQALKYLVITSILQRNLSDFDKYIRFFDRSLFYRSWAKQQKERMRQALQNPAQSIEGLPETEVFKDFFINYKYIHSTLLYLLDSNPKNRAAFEYLMAYYLLQKDFGAAKDCMDKYYAGFDYPEMPTHWEEFLALYYHSNRHATQTLPVSGETAGRYEQFRLLVMAPTTGEISALLKSRYGNTYWYYTSFTPVSTLNNDTEHESKTIY
ncbi:MAG: DUF6057 family protein [Dysgonamonadaceae bacterium]|jgi:hypothetical protein|nr:DUF6057 family protein [Dysgonamonadaceae bacterium]